VFELILKTCQNQKESTQPFSNKKAVELSYARGNAAEVCRELGLNPLVLGRWRREAKKYGGNSFPGKGNPKLTDEQREIAELKKKLRDVEIERDILKKAIVIFS
jgi:transposase